MARAIDADALWKEVEPYGLHKGCILGKHGGLADILMDIIEKQPTISLAKQEWISVKDKKPEVGVRVMVCGKRGGINIGRLDYPEDEYICVEKGHCYRGYTHWMPLPEPPKEL